MSTRMTNGFVWGLLWTALISQGCANVVSEGPGNELVLGAPVIERGEVQHTLVISKKGDDSLEPRSAPITESVLAVSAVAIQPATITTPQTQRSTREVVPYSGLNELWEWPFTTILGWVPLLEGDLGFVNYIDGINPFMNSAHFNRTRETETLSETPMQPRVEKRDDLRRLGGATIALGFPGMPRVEMKSREERALVVPLERLMTRPLASAPRHVEGMLAFKGSNETVRVRFALAPEISNRLLRASRRLSQMNGADPADIASALVELENLGFPTRAQTVERNGTARHGAAVMGRAVAEVHIDEARAAYARNDRNAARASIRLARARVKRGPKDWDLLEADVHEASGLSAIEEKDYERARSEFLTASRLDSGRQTRLAGFVAIAIEAMDRETAREERASQSAATPVAGPASAPASAMSGGSSASNVLQQCLTREAALQACRLMPGFGKEICKSGVRAKYSSISCP